jgi:hypothetical protein
MGLSGKWPNQLVGSSGEAIQAAGECSAPPGGHAPTLQGAPIAPERLRCHGDAVFPCQVSSLLSCLSRSQGLCKN